MLTFLFVWHVLYSIRITITCQLYMCSLYLIGSASQNYKGNSCSKVLLTNVTSLFVW